MPVLIGATMSDLPWVDVEMRRLDLGQNCFQFGRIGDRVIGIHQLDDVVDDAVEASNLMAKLLITSDHITIDFVTRAGRYLNIGYTQVAPRYDGEIFFQGYIVIDALKKEVELEAAA